MSRRSGGWRIIALLAGLAAGALSGPGDTAEKALIRVEKGDLWILPAEVLARLHGIQELETSWVILASDEQLSELAARRVPAEILDISPEGKAYFLVFLRSPEAAGGLRGFGEVRILDEWTVLFWSGGREAREILPAEFKLKRLSPEDRFPVVRPGRERAVSAAEADVRLRRRAAELIPQFVSLVSKANLTKNIQDLQDFRTRYASTAACEYAGTFLFEHFSSLPGLETSYDPFLFAGTRTTRNIVAVLPGKSNADRSVILCAHYDSTSNQPTTNAPGADDNASGTAAVMEIARVLSSYAFDFSLKFICFSAEEWGLYGSKHYAQKAKAAGETIIGVVNMDMIGYEDVPSEDIDIIVNPASDWLGARYLSAAERYAPLPTLKIVNASFRGSDHSPFWDQGYHALCGIEDAGVPNPHYHKTTDTLSTLNMDFVTSVTRASLALGAELAQPVVSLSAPAGLTARSQVLTSLFSNAKTVFLDWRTTSDQAVGYNVYRSTNRERYEKANGTLLTATTFTDRFLRAGSAYYYAVTAVDSSGRESNFSAEVRDDAGNRK